MVIVIYFMQEKLLTFLLHIEMSMTQMVCNRLVSMGPLVI